jgi:hypothetical protein
MRFWTVVIAGDAILAGLAENDPKNPVVGMLKRLRDPAFA